MNYGIPRPENSKHVPNGKVVMAAILGETKVLLIKEVTKPTPHFFKFPAETVEPGESILSALKRGVEEEAGVKDLQVRYSGGDIVEVIDSRFKVVRQLMAPHWVHSHYYHKRYFWGLLTTDVFVKSLAGQHLFGDKNEEIYTAVFDLAELDKMMDFHPQHRELIKQLAHAPTV